MGRGPLLRYAGVREEVGREAMERGEGGRGGEAGLSCEVDVEAATEPLFSATTFRDFSKTFQSLMVLSGGGARA